MKFGKLVDYDRDCRPSYSGFTGRPDKDGTRSRPLQRKWHEVLHGCRPFGSFLFDGLGYRVGKSRSKLTCSCEGPYLLSPENFWKPICCILVTTCCEISCFFKTTAKKLGDQYIVGPPNLKVGGPVSLPTVVAPMLWCSARFSPSAYSRLLYSNWLSNRVILCV